jgi:hypothetical protein
MIVRTGQANPHDTTGYVLCPQASVVFGKERVMPPKEIPLVSDAKLLSAMCASVRAIRDIVRRSLELIEQSRIMLRELDTHEIDGRQIS